MHLCANSGSLSFRSFLTYLLTQQQKQKLRTSLSQHCHSNKLHHPPPLPASSFSPLSWPPCVERAIRQEHISHVLSFLRIRLRWCFPGGHDNFRKMINEAEPLGYPVVVKNARGHRGERTVDRTTPFKNPHQGPPDGNLKFIDRVLMIKTVVLQSWTHLCLHILQGWTQLAPSWCVYRPNPPEVTR